MMKARTVIVICQRLFGGCNGGLVNSSLGKSIPIDDGPFEEWISMGIRLGPVDLKFWFYKIQYLNSGRQFPIQNQICEFWSSIPSSVSLPDSVITVSDN